MGTQQAGTPGLRLGEFVRANKAQILAEWEREISRLPKARALPHARRLDHLPEILERIARVADAESPDALGRLLEAAPDEHAVERLDEGFDLADVVMEYSLLRRVVLRHWERDGVGSAHPDALVDLEAAFDQAIVASVSRYSRARDRTLAALDRIAATALDREAALPALLDALSRVLLDTTEAVDSVVILLREGDSLVLRAAAGLDGERLEQIARAFAQAFGRDLLASRAPLLLSARPMPGSESPPPSSAAGGLLDEHGLRALYAVPLVLGDEAVGVANIASRTAHAFSEEDRVLFRTMVSRASALVAQAQLAERATRLAAEERAARLEAERQARLLEAVLAQVPAGVLVAEAGSERLLVHNRAAEAFWRGRPSAPTLAAYRPGQLRTLDDAPLAVDDIPIVRALRRGETTKDCLLRAVRDDGTAAVLVANAGPVKDGAGRTIAAVAAFLDVTERQREREELSNAVADRERMLSILSHDLRGPLTAVRLSADRVRRRPELPETLRGPMAQIMTSATRMAAMIRDLLDFSRARFRGGLPVDPAPTDLADVCRRAADELRAAHAGAAIAVEIEGDTTGAWDAERVAQVLANLLQNALVHGAPDRPIVLSARGTPAAVVLRVHNDGAPIPPATLPHLFDPFRRGGGDGEAHAGGAGLGLGLFIVAQIVKAHGGRIEVTSAAESGTTFTVTLPRRAPPAPSGALAP